jgi:hypothetical protein
VGPANILYHISCHLLAAHHSTSCRFAPHLFVSFMSSMSSLHVDPLFDCFEFDTHVDPCALGQSFVPFAYTWRLCDISPYNTEHGDCKCNVPIISSGTTAYTCQDSGQTFILVINEGLWFGNKITNSLVNQSQI